jgi:membrane protein
MKILDIFKEGIKIIYSNIIYFILFTLIIFFTNTYSKKFIINNFVYTLITVFSIIIVAKYYDNYKINIKRFVIYYFILVIFNYLTNIVYTSTLLTSFNLSLRLVFAYFGYIFLIKEINFKYSIKYSLSLFGMSMYSMLKTIIFSYIILYIPLYAYLMRYTTEKISSLSSNLEFDAMVKMVVDLLGERIILISTYSIVVGIFITLNLGILYYNLTGLKGGENNR